MYEELETIQLLDERLNELGIPYMVTGSLALSYYSVPRQTRDVDIVIELKSDDVPKMMDCFREDFYIDESMIHSAIKHDGIFNIIYNKYVLRIDCIVRKNTPFRCLEFERRQKINMEGFSFWVVSAEDLIISKLYWAKDSESEIQITDLKNILNFGLEIDEDYLSKWISDLDLTDIHKKVSNE